MRLGLAVLGLVAGAAAGLLVAGPQGDAPAEGALPRTLATLEPTPQPEPSPSPAPTHAAATDAALIAEAGPRNPPEPFTVGSPVRVVIPAIDVDVPLVPVGLLDSGAMEVPDFGLAGWYELGPRPGEPGPAVLAGHVDSRAGPDVFYRLRELAPGDEVRVVDTDGAVTRFTVHDRELTDKDALPVERIWDDTDEPVLRLITCGGEFDRRARSYRSNVIVYATLVG